jgi:hypothetical protein
MKPYLHAKSSVRNYGGVVDDYIAIHNFLDSSKAHVADMRHRAMFHHSFGCYLAEEQFGLNILNSAGKTVSVRDVAEEHILEDMGRIPSLLEYLEGMPLYEWLGGLKKTTFHIPLAD